MSANSVRPRSMCAVSSGPASPVLLSVCIITGNEEENIRRCLESVAFADEIVVVDSFSTDRTLDIARDFTDRVFQHRWTGYIGQKAIARNLARGEWILFVDADEAVSPGLRNEILSTLGKGIPPDVSGFDFPRMVWFLHRWIRHGDWYPDTKLRLFRKSAGHCCGTEPHERIDVVGEVLHFRNPLYHYTYDDIEDQLRTMNRFSSISADNSRLQRYSLLKILACMLLHPPFRFLRCYVFKRGFLDGVAGIVIASTVAYGTFIKYAKVWEKRIESRRRERASEGGSSAALAIAIFFALLFPLPSAAQLDLQSVPVPAASEHQSLANQSSSAIGTHDEVPALALLDSPAAPGAGLPDSAAPWLSDPAAMLAASEHQSLANQSSPAIGTHDEVPALALLDSPAAPGAGLPDSAAPWLSDPAAMLAASEHQSLANQSSPAIGTQDEVPALALLDSPAAPGAGLPDSAAPWRSDPAAMLAACAARMPRERVRLDGRINMRRRYGVSLRAYGFSVAADFAASPVVMDFRLSKDDGTPVEEIRAVRDASGALALSRISGTGPAPQPSDPIAGTDVSWFDACMDFLWWRNPRFAGVDRVKGRDCVLLDVDAPSPTAACARARLWIDPEQLVALQATQYDAAGREMRRVWVRAVQRRKGRWVFKDLEVESRGGAHRTRLHFEGVEFPDSSDAGE